MTHIRDYDYITLFGQPTGDFPSAYEIPKGNTGSTKDQGSVDACVAEVICQIAEEMWKRQTGVQREQSEGYAYATFRPEDSNSPGLILSYALKCWVAIGTVPKYYFPLIAEMPGIKEVAKRHPELLEMAAQNRISGYCSLNYADRKKRDLCIKDALMRTECGLVAVSNKYFGASHCIMLTGWDDKKGVYTYKNSYGEEKLYGTIPKERIDAVYFPFLEEIKLPFTDVPVDDWALKEIKSVYLSGMMNGTSNTTFEPDRYLTRREMAVLLHRMAKADDQRNDAMMKMLMEILEERR